MTAFTYFIWPRQRKDGAYSVAIRVSHNSRAKYLESGVLLSRKQISRDGSKIKDEQVLEIVQKKIQKLKDAYKLVERPDKMSVEQIVESVTEISNRPKLSYVDLFEFAERQMASMENKTAEGYRTAMNAVRRFIGGDSLDINEITTSWVLQFREFLETEPALKGKAQKSRGSRAVSYYLRCLSTLHEKAKTIYNDYDNGEIVIPRQPFKKGVIPKQPVTEHRVLTAAQIKALMETSPSEGSRAEMARDVFILSFALAGTNTVDIYNFKKSDVKGGLVTYNRAKTDSRREDKARITLIVPPIVKPILKRYKAAKDSEYLLNFERRYSNHHEFNRNCNLGLKEVAKLANIKENLTTYYARHSWATIARNVCRIDFDTVNSALNHSRTGGDRLADIYIARDYTAIWKAQDTVIAEVEKACQKRMPMTPLATAVPS